MNPSLSRRVVAEFTGSLLLLAVVVDYDAALASQPFGGC